MAGQPNTASIGFNFLFSLDTRSKTNPSVLRLPNSTFTTLPGITDSDKSIGM